MQAEETVEVQLLIKADFVSPFLFSKVVEPLSPVQPSFVLQIIGRFTNDNGSNNKL